MVIINNCKSIAVTVITTGGTKLDAYYLVLFSSRIRVKVEYRVWLASGYAPVYMSACVVTEREPAN